MNAHLGVIHGSTSRRCKLGHLPVALFLSALLSPFLRCVISFQLCAAPFLLAFFWLVNTSLHNARDHPRGLPSPLHFVMQLCDILNTGSFMLHYFPPPDRQVDVSLLYVDNRLTICKAFMKLPAFCNTSYPTMCTCLPWNWSTKMATNSLALNCRSILQVKSCIPDEQWQFYTHSWPPP